MNHGNRPDIRRSWPRPDRDKALYQATVESRPAPPPPRRRQFATVDPERILATLRAYPGVFFKIVPLTLLLALLATFLLPKRYEAAADVIVDPIIVDPVSGVPTNLNAAAFIGYVSTQADVIRSERVANGVVERLKLDQVPYYVDKWRKANDGRSFENFASAMLLKDLNVRMAREGNVIKVVAFAPTAQQAADNANGFVASYLDTIAALRTAPARESSRFLDERLQLAGDAVNRARDNLVVFQRQAGLSVSDERLDAENKRLSDLTEQLSQIEGQVSESRSRRDTLRESPVDDLPEVQDSGLVQSLREEISGVEKEIQRKAATLGARHPDMIALRGELAALNTRLRTELDRFKSGVSVRMNVDGRRLAELRRQLDEQRARVIDLRGKREQLAVYQQQFDTAQENYKAISLRMSRSDLESGNRVSNTMQLSEAVPPAKPASPKLLINLALGLVAGIGLATALIIARDRKQPLVRNIQDVERAIDLPVLATIPPLDEGASGLLMAPRPGVTALLKG